MSSLSSLSGAAENGKEEAGKSTESLANFNKAISDWTDLSSGNTITGEFFNFFKQLGELAGKLGDLINVVNKYI